MNLECKPGATVITFDDVLSPNPGSGNLTGMYAGFNWTEAHYLNAMDSWFDGTGYRRLVTSGSYVGWFGTNMTIKLATTNSTFTFNSCLMAAEWLGPINVVIIRILYCIMRLIRLI